VVLFDVKEDMIVRRWYGHSRAVTKVRARSFVPVFDGSSSCRLGFCQTIFASSERDIISASADGHILRWSVDHEDPIQELLGHDKAVFGMSVSPGGTHLVSGGRDATVRLWDLERALCVDGQFMDDNIVRSHRALCFVYTF
jgi:WD40 repeat protein